jgi:hypothetical protein
MSAVTSTSAKVKAEGFRKILRTYQLYDVGFSINENGDLVLNGGDRDIFGSPRALELSDLPRREDFPDEESWDRAEFQAFIDMGEGGFRRLLSELSAVLETPLLIVCLTWTYHGGEARAWRVTPGNNEVEDTGIEAATEASEFLGTLSDEECWANWMRAKGTTKPDSPEAKEGTA